MKEKPIIFSTEMVRAILEGRKIQTRRIIKLRDGSIPEDENISYDFEGKPLEIMDFSKTFPYRQKLKSPYQKDQILWVRETFCKADDGIVYRASDYNEESMKDFGYKWKPSIYMPRKVARLFLRVKNVRIERLQDISEDEIIEEGVNVPFCPKCGYTALDCSINWDHNLCALEDPESGIKYFQILWNKINKKRGYGWDENPYVFVIDFERI